MFTHYLTGTFNVLFDNGTTRDTLIANYQSHDAWDTVTVDMSSRKGQVGRIVFEGWGPKQSNDYNAYFYIRNLQIIEIVEAPAAPVEEPAPAPAEAPVETPVETAAPEQAE